MEASVGYFLVGVVLMTIGYSFSECARYVSMRRSDTLPAELVRSRLVRRLSISILLLFVCGLIALRLFWWTGEPSLAFFLLFSVGALGSMIAIFTLLFRDVRETRKEVKALQERLQKEILSSIEHLPPSGKGEPVSDQ
jgi:hypothetical protein